MAAAKSLNSSLTTPLEQQAVAGTTNREIRAHVKNLTTEQRMKFMTDAINNGRSKVLTSVLGAESFLSGLTDGIHASLTPYCPIIRTTPERHRSTSWQATIAVEPIYSAAISSLLQPLHLLLMTFAGWVSRHQLDAIDYLQEENRVLKERLGGRRIRAFNAQRRLHPQFKPREKRDCVPSNATCLHCCMFRLVP